MDEQQLQQMFIQWLAQQTGAKNQQELEAIIQQMGEQGLQQAYALFMQELQGQQQAQATQMAKHGAKLNYIKSLRGQCPDGYEVSYYKQGGNLRKTCKKCEQQVKMAQGGEMPSDPVEAFKCGRKMKKKKCEAGAPIEMDKCGGKTKKKKAACGVKMDKCGDKMKFMKKGDKTLTPKYTSENTTGEAIMAGSPTTLWDKPAQALRNLDGSVYMGRVISQPGDTIFVLPNLVPMDDPRYPTYRTEFNKNWTNPTNTSELFR